MTCFLGDIDFQAASYAETRGIIIADTKFEFGETETGEIILIDEVLTPGIRPSASLAIPFPSRFPDFPMREI